MALMGVSVWLTFTNKSLIFVVGIAIIVVVAVLAVVILAVVAFLVVRSNKQKAIRMRHGHGRGHMPPGLPHAMVNNAWAQGNDNHILPMKYLIPYRMHK